MKINKENILYHLLLFGGLSLIIGLSFSHMFSDQETFRCKNIEIIGKKYLISQIKIEKLCSHNILEKNIFQIDKNQIETTLMNHDFISNAKVSVILPNTIIIDIDEIYPVALISLKDKYLANERFEIQKIGIGIWDQLSGVDKKYSANEDNKLMTPQIKLNDSLNIDSIKTQIEFKIIYEMFLNYKENLYDRIKSIEFDNDKDKIVVILKNQTKVELHKDINICINQINDLDIFLKSPESKLGTIKFDYIKFVDELVIVKEG